MGADTYWEIISAGLVLSGIAIYIAIHLAISWLLQVAAERYRANKVLTHGAQLVCRDCGKLGMTSSVGRCEFCHHAYTSI